MSSVHAVQQGHIIIVADQRTWLTGPRNPLIQTPWVPRFPKLPSRIKIDHFSFQQSSAAPPLALLLSSLHPRYHSVRSLCSLVGP